MTRPNDAGSYIEVGGLVLPDDPKALVDAYNDAVAARQVDFAARICRAAARLGHQYLATTARCGEALQHYDEATYDALCAEDEAAEAKLAILQAVPKLRAAIQALPKEEVDAIWAKHG